MSDQVSYKIRVFMSYLLTKFMIQYLKAQLHWIFEGQIHIRFFLTVGSGSGFPREVEPDPIPSRSANLRIPPLSGEGMVLILDGNSEIDAHVGSNQLCFVCLIHLIRSRAVTNRILFSENKYLFFSIRSHHIMSYHLI